MEGLGSLLEKFKKLLSSTEAYKKDVLNCINSVSRANLTPKDLIIKEQVIYIKANPTTRTEIYMKKGLILKELQALIRSKPPTDIRFN